MLNGEGQPTFWPVSKLSQVLGVEAHTIPVSYRTWKDVPIYVKDDLCSRILEKFSFGGQDCSEWVLETANGAWKRKMKKIRDERMKGKSLTDALLSMPLGHDKKKWENICLAWQPEEYKVTGRCMHFKFATYMHKRRSRDDK